MTITDNVERNLTALGIQGIDIFETRPDRVFAWDHMADMAVECLINREHWMLDKWDPLHGKSTRESFREKTRPSMQVCFHACVNEENGARYFVEIDFDEAPPSNPITILIHGKECLVNALTGHLTDQDDIARRLDERFGVTHNV